MLLAVCDETKMPLGNAPTFKVSVEPACGLVKVMVNLLSCCEPLVPVSVMLLPEEGVGSCAAIDTAPLP